LFVSRKENAKEPDVANGLVNASTTNVRLSQRNVTGEDLHLVIDQDVLANGDNALICANKEDVVAKNVHAMEDSALLTTLNATGQERRFAHQRRAPDAIGNQLVNSEEEDGVATEPRPRVASEDH